MDKNQQESARSITNLLLYPTVQRPALLLVFLTAGLSFLSLGTFIYLETQLLLEHAKHAGTHSTVMSFLWQYGLICGGLFLLSILLMGVWALLFTHRMIGPVNRIKRELDEMYREDAVHLITLREDDYLRPLVQKYNQILWALSINSDWDEPSEIPDEDLDLTKNNGQVSPETDDK